MLHALPSSALTSIWMSLILKLFASDIIFASHSPAKSSKTLRWNCPGPYYCEERVFATAIVWAYDAELKCKSVLVWSPPFS